MESEDPVQELPLAIETLKTTHCLVVQSCIMMAPRRILEMIEENVALLLIIQRGDKVPQNHVNILLKDKDVLPHPPCLGRRVAVLVRLSEANIPVSIRNVVIILPQDLAPMMKRDRRMSPDESINININTEIVAGAQGDIKSIKKTSRRYCFFEKKEQAPSFNPFSRKLEQ